MSPESNIETAGLQLADTNLADKADRNLADKADRILADKVAGNFGGPIFLGAKISLRNSTETQKFSYETLRKVN